MKLLTPKFFPNGFTLIELMVVIGIAALLATVTIPSYIAFSRNQELSQTSLNLKSLLRDTQNRALASEKSTTLCTASDTLLGFYATLTPGSTTIAVGGICGANIIFNNTTPLYSNGSSINSFVNASVTPCTAITLNQGTLTVLFKPLSQGTQFFDGDTTGVGLNYSKIGIKIVNSQGKIDYVMVQNSGDIYEKSSCP